MRMKLKSIGARFEHGPEMMQFDWTDGALAEGLRLYDAGEFFTAHEAWESVWLGSPEPEKTFLQGLIQVTAAFHHLKRDNPLGTMLLLQAALRRLDRYPESFGGISVELLRHDIRERLRTLEAGAPRSQLASPRIRPGSRD
jgi:predicted metal-dependent hydrolase